MSQHSDRAYQLFREGYNCSQAVLAAFCDVTHLSFDTSVQISSSFGGGMGRMREVCGALSGAFMVLGMLYGRYATDDRSAKAAHYKRIQDFAEDFKKENHGTILCKELLGETKVSKDPVPEARTETYYRKRPCGEIVRGVAILLDRYLENHERNENGEG